MHTIEVSLVGGNPIAREGLRMLLEGQGFHVAESVKHAADVAADSAVILVDDRPASAVAEDIRGLRNRRPEARIVALLEEADAGEMREVLAAGASQCLCKLADANALGAAIHLSLMDGAQLQRAYAGRSRSAAAPAMDPMLDLLSNREREILGLLTRGDTNAQIGRELNITEQTVKVFMRQILKKLALGNRTQAAFWAQARGLAPISPSSDD